MCGCRVLRLRPAPVRVRESFIQQGLLHYGQAEVVFRPASEQARVLALRVEGCFGRNKPRGARPILHPPDRPVRSLLQPTVPPMWGRCRQAYTLCHSRTCVCKAMLFRQRLHVAAWHCGNGRSEDVYGPIPAADPSTSIRTTEVTASDSFSSMRISDSSQPFNAFKAYQNKEAST